MGKRAIEFCLTEYGRGQVEQNQAMVRFMFNKYLPPYGVDRDDWFSECQIALIQAVAWHVPSRGELSTLLDRLVFLRRSNLNQKWKAKRASRDIRALSLDEAHGEDEASLLLNLGREDDSLQSLEMREIAGMVRDALSLRGKRICDLISDGLGVSEVGRALGFTKQYASQSLRAERAKLVKLFPGLVKVSGMACLDCGGNIVVAKTGSRPTRCPECSEHRTRKQKVASWRKGNRRRSKSNV